MILVFNINNIYIFSILSLICIICMGNLSPSGGLMLAYFTTWEYTTQIHKAHVCITTHIEEGMGCFG